MGISHLNVIFTSIVKHKKITNLSFLRKKSSLSSDIIFEEFEQSGIIILNRPQVLNCINISSAKQIYTKLQEWEKTKKFLIVKGSGDKAFSVGADLAELKSTKKPGQNMNPFIFKQGYRIIALIKKYQIPYISLIDGIVMGGGVGLSVHGPYRVVTEKTILAMPEIKIGFIPDVGSSYFLSRLRGKLGLFLALTGYSLQGFDLKQIGIATHFVYSQSLKNLENELVQCSNKKDIEEVLLKYHISVDSKFSLEPMMDIINSCFEADSIEEILNNLQNSGTFFAKNILNILLNLSPTSLKITMRQLEEGNRMSLEECLRMEYRIVSKLIQNNDFNEGIRIFLTDKKRKPVWNPLTLAEVSSDLVSSYFMKLPENEELRF